MFVSHCQIWKTHWRVDHLRKSILPLNLAVYSPKQNREGHHLWQERGSSIPGVWWTTRGVTVSARIPKSCPFKKTLCFSHTTWCGVCVDAQPAASLESCHHRQIDMDQIPSAGGVANGNASQHEPPEVSHGPPKKNRVIDRYSTRYSISSSEK